MNLRLRLASLVGLGYLAAVTRAIQISIGNPTQCDDLTIKWTGGQPPFQLVLAPVFDVATVINISSSAFVSNKGSYTIPQLPLVANDTFLLALSDATGFENGATSSLLVVGNSTGNINCSTTGPAIAFTFDVQRWPLQQCRPYTFSGYENAILPVTIMGLISSGTSIMLRPNATQETSYSWTANVTEGDSVVFVMMDAEGRQGGTSNITTVGPSDDTHCFDTTPSTSSIVPSPTSGGPTTTVTATPPPGSPGVSMSTIAGAVAGSVGASATIFAAALCCLRRRRSSRTPPSEEFMTSESNTNRRRFAFPFGSRSNGSNHIEPFPFQATPASQTLPLMHHREGSFQFGDARGYSPSSSVRTKVTVGGYPSSLGERTHVVRHTDVEDMIAGSSRVIELPPQYSEHRHPLSSLATSS
ncbi:hypothetical protein BJ138DRAFT_702813 [Hygrophoropsis aurantiaca]|uniref:Uncharacterized protein n=1 Tax=Hygrophoropsis aurantiaca TaxID=72124 RepID=A0ACB8AHS6_9AGAM|nr:hypothetical protein BJ138DRAFT_702813 [Hygrophoropsis aurantiaca]